MQDTCSKHKSRKIERNKVDAGFGGGIGGIEGFSEYR